MDAEYLKANVGELLSAGLAETVMMHPDDPVDYLAQFLRKSVGDQALEQTASISAERRRKSQLLRPS